MGPRSTAGSFPGIAGDGRLRRCTNAPAHGRTANERHLRILRRQVQILTLLPRRQTRHLYSKGKVGTQIGIGNDLSLVINEAEKLATGRFLRYPLRSTHHCVGKRQTLMVGIATLVTAKRTTSFRR